ncbi:tetratricopeptide repeat protein [Acidobacteria bacterium AB60]|nr:tetratricopeptide repeat protein [Acidobacteria bacterium AB60]
MATATQLIADGRRARPEHRLSDARRLYAEAAALYRPDDQLAYAHTIRHIADMFLEESRHADAQPLYEEALELYRGSLNTKLIDLANTVRPYALLQSQLGNREVARELWQEARILYAALRIEAGVRECEEHLDRFEGQPLDGGG